MKKTKILRQVVQASGLPEDVVLGAPRLLLRGDRMLFIENHHGVVEYSPDKMRVKTMLGVLEINGAMLTLSALGEEDLMVSGQIRSIAFL